MTNVTTVQCPTCKKNVEWTTESKFKPFCSDKCKLIDFGDWATEAHCIPGKSQWLEPLEDEDNIH